MARLISTLAVAGNLVAIGDRDGLSVVAGRLGTRTSSA